MADNTLNDQITDSVAFAHILTIGQASAQSLAIVEAVGSETIGASMHNAVRSQQNAQMTSAAAVTAACARMLGARYVSEPDPGHQSDMLKLQADPTTGATDPSNVGRDTRSAMTAVEKLLTDAEIADRQAAAARDALKALASIAEGTKQPDDPPNDPPAPKPDPTSDPGVES